MRPSAWLLPIALLAGWAAFPASASPRASTTGACVTDADSISSFRDAVYGLVFYNDSSEVVSLGLPYRPAAGVSAVTNDSICAAAVAAHNTRYGAGSPSTIARAVVLQVGTTRYAVWGAVDPSLGTRPTFLVFDTTWNYLKAIT